MNRPMPDHITDGPADNWPGDQTDQEWWEERERKRKAISRDTIREIVTEAMDDKMCDLIRRYVVTRSPRAPEHVMVGAALNDRITTAVEAYLEAQE